MTVRVVLFASLREELGCDSVDVALEGGSRLSDLIRTLASSRGELWKTALTAENIKVAVNQELVTSDVSISEHDEVAFFPPVTGG